MKRERLNISEEEQVSNYKKSLKSAANRVISSLRKKNQDTENQTSTDEGQKKNPTQADWYELKKARFEYQKQQELANKSATRKAEISGALKGIQTQQISKDDPEGTAYKKLIGNVGSAVGGLTKAGIAAAKPKPVSQQQDLRVRGKPGRPRTQTEPPKPQDRGGALAIREPSGALTKPPSSPLVDKRRMLPGSTQGGTRVGQPVKTIGQPAPQRPALPMGLNKRRMLPGSTQGGTQVGKPATQPTLGQKARASQKVKTGLIQQRMGEGYSDWRQELIIEQSLIIEVQEVETKKGKKKKIIDILKGENKVEINPKIGDYFGYNESYEDETFRQHSRETFSSHSPSEARKRTAGVLKLMKQMNADVEKPKKKKKKKTVSEECGCEKNDKKNDMIVALVKSLVNAKKKKNFQLNNEIIGESSPAWQRKAGKNPEGGLNKKGIASYRREHPGSHLSLAVTTPPSKLDPDSKAAKRRKSFCARMSGNPGPMKDEKGRPTRKALSLRKWNC
jgi:hypothetical protein